MPLDNFVYILRGEDNNDHFRTETVVKVGNYMRWLFVNESVIVVDVN